MGKNPRVYLRDIVDSCDRIISNVSNATLESFRDDLNLQDAVIRRFEIIGEAIKRVPESVRKKYPDVPWKYAAGFRDVLIHDYPEILIDEVYKTGKNDLPAFRDQIKKALEDLNSGTSRFIAEADLLGILPQSR